MTDTLDPVATFLDAWKELTVPGAPFAMEETTIFGRPARIFPMAPPNLRAVWEGSAGYGELTYIVYEDEHYTYAEIHRQVRALAHYLATEHGIKEGDRVALSMRNYPEWVVTYWAVISLGATLVGMNAWWISSEMEYALRETQPTIVIVDEERLERLLPILDSLRQDHPLAVVATRIAGEWPDGVIQWSSIVEREAPDTLPEATIKPEDDATIFFTSGTTGQPKGAQITHIGSITNLMNLIFMTSVAGAADAKMAASAANGEAPVTAEEQPATPVYLASTPLFHVTALNCLLHPVTVAGATVVLMYRWDAGRALELIEREKVTNLSGVPTMSREVLTHPDWSKRDTSSLTGMSGGGAPVPPDLVDKIGSSISEGAATTGYGLTETSGIVTANAAGSYVAKPASCGPVVPTLDAKLVDELGNDLPKDPNTVGQLWVRGPVVIKGYFKRPDATDEAIVDGWFDTGDVARIDEDGFVYIVDRAKDMVLRGGENIYSSEVEAAIYEHDDVAEVAVFGIPDERLGEIVAAVIVPTPGADLDIEELKAFVAERLARHKIPEAITLRTEPLPVNANGKFLKRQLRSEYYAD